MFTEFLTQGNLLVWPLVALAIFFTVFLGVLMQVFLGWRRPRAPSDVTRLRLADDDSSPADAEGVAR